MTARVRLQPTASDLRLERRRRADEAARRRQDLAAREAAALREIARLRAQHAALAEVVRRAAAVTAAPLAPEPFVEPPGRSEGAAPSAAWVAEVGAARARMQRTLDAHQQEGFRAAVDRVVAGELARLDAAPSASVTPAATPPAPAWGDEVVAAVRRNVERLEGVADDEVRSALLDQAGRTAAAVRAGDRQRARDALDLLRAGVAAAAETERRRAHEREEAGVLREHLEDVAVDADPDDPELAAWLDHLDRVVVGAAALDPDVARRAADHVAARALGAALSDLGYVVDDDFTVALARDGVAAVPLDGPDADDHGVRLRLRPGAVLDVGLVRDADAPPDDDLDRALEQRWCDEALPRLVAAVGDHGLALSVGERTGPGSGPLERVSGLRDRPAERSAARRRRDRGDRTRAVDG